MEQIDKLAGFIIEAIDGEPSLDEGAGDCAIRIIKGQIDALEKLARLGNGDLYGNSDGNVLAQRALGLNPSQVYGCAYFKKTPDDIPFTDGMTESHKGLTADVN